ncbi:MAG: patatin-like phospholipase family protein [Spirochaetales bacterium]|nr:patatin-like phospholipase family protein [Spirochaetales bacterium]
MAKKKTAFVLSGGGLRGCFQVGALKYLMEEKKIKPDIVCGISTGSLQALGVAQGINLEKFWTENIRKKSDIYSSVINIWTVLALFGIYCALYGICAGILYFFIPIYLACIIGAPASVILFGLIFAYIIFPNITIKSINMFSGLKKILKKHFDKQALDKSKIELHVGTVDLKSSVLTYHAKKNITAQDILASCTIPVFFPPVKENKLLRVDGGVRDIAPMRIALKKGATDIYLIICDPLEPYPYPHKIKNLLNVLDRTLAIMSHEIIINDIETAIKKNELADKSRYRKINLYVIDPDLEFIEMLGDVLDVNPKKIAKGIIKGKERAETVLKGKPMTKKRIEEILKKISPTGE